MAKDKPAFLSSVERKEENNPVFFDFSKSEDRKKASKLSRNLIVRDDYIEQVREYFQVLNPSMVYTPEFEPAFADYLNKLKKEKPLWQQGRWVYFSWAKTLVHILEEDSFFKVRTARNRYLIADDEQNKFYNSSIGIAGLSVGNSVALAIALQGGGKTMRLADHDALSLSNMNRIRTSIASLGLPKVLLTARQIYEINPYARVELYGGGLTEKNISKFFQGPPKLDIIVDEIDNLAVKYLIRQQAKKHKIAVVMGADNGDNAIVDIERYDLKPQPRFFHGRMGPVSFDYLKKLDKFGIGKKIARHLGPENITEKAETSFLEIGKTLVSWPQLGGAAFINGSAVAYCVRKILSGSSLITNRCMVSLDEKFIPNFNTKREADRRHNAAMKFKKIIGL